MKNKRTFNILGISLIILLTFSLATSANEDLTGEKAEIEKIINGAIGWALTKDFDMLYNNRTQGEDLFLFSPISSQPTIGFKAFKKYAEENWLSDDFKATSFEVKDLRINISRSGTVAWWSALLDDCYEIKGKPGCWKDVRWTGVLEKRNGKWLIIQTHMSFAMDKVAELLKTKNNN